MPYRIDLHVHTRRYSPCAEFVREHELATHAKRSGLSGLVITEHDHLWTVDEIEKIRAGANGVRLFRGVECTVQGAHLVVIGLDDMGTLVKKTTLEEVVRHARSQEAVVILAHPYRDANPEELNLHLVDALEVGSTSFSAAEADRSNRLAERLRKPRVASSDAHALMRIGWAWTEFQGLPADEKQLAQWIREGRGRPIIPHPFLS